MGKWQDLTAKQKAQVIKFARQNGVSDIKTIRDTYNLYSSDGNLAHKKSGEEQVESQYIQKQDNTNVSNLPIIEPESLPSDMWLTDQQLAEFNHKKVLYENEGLNIVSPEFDLLTLVRGFMTEPIRILKEKNTSKKPLALAAEDFKYGTKDKIYEYFDNAIKSEAIELLQNPRHKILLNLPQKDIAIYRNLPDEVLDIYSKGVIPRMVEQRPWLNADDFIRDTEKALLYRSPGYAVYPDEIFVKAGLDDMAGMYFPSTGQVSIAEGYVQKALPHEIRHKLDDAIDLTLSESKYLQNAYGNIFSDIKGFKTSDMAKEIVTTNLDSRLKLLGRHSTSDIKIQNALIDRASDDQIFKAIEQSNSYGQKFIELLREQGSLTPERAQHFRDAMKYVGMISAPTVLATTTDNQKSTGGPLYPFSFEKNPFLKTPIVRYDEGGQTYTVKKGDTFSQIAQNIGVSVQDLQKLNPTITNVNRIREGQSINIPSYMFSEIFNTPQFTGLSIPQIQRTQPLQQQNTPIQSVVVPTQKGLKTAGPLDLQELAVRQAYTESRLRPEIVNDKGAYGLFQIMQPALDDYNRINKTNYTLEDMKNADNNIKVRNWYMDYLSNLGFINKGDIQSDSVQMYKTLAAFNAGAGPVRDALTKAKADGKDIYDSWDWVSYLWDEPREYADFILRGIETIGTNKNDSAYKAVSTAKSDTANKIRSSIK